MTDSDRFDPEEAYYKRNRLLKVVGLVFALLLACGVGMVLGGAATYGLTRLIDRPSESQSSVPSRGLTIDKHIEEEIEKELEALAPSSGAVIVEVVTGSPAEDAGLQEGDVIIAVDGRQLAAGRGLADAIASYEPGDRLTLEIERPDEGSLRVRVTLGAHPEQQGAAYLGVVYSDPSRVTIPELDLSPFHRFEEFGMPFVLPEGGSLQGALVVQVADGSPAAAAGLTEGDVIAAVDGDPIESPEALSEAVAEHKPGDTVSLTVYRPGDGEEREIRATLAEHPDDGDRAYLGVGLTAFLHMERVGGPEGSQRFRYRERPYRFEVPLDELPFDLDQLPFRQRGMPFNWDDLPFDPEDLPFDLDELPFDPEDLERHLEFDDQSI